MKRRLKKGFTLAELLIVMAIIAILVAIMFPVFGSQLDKARAAAELANVRAKYSEVVADAILGTTTTTNGKINLTVDENASIMIQGKKLAAALMYDATEITAKSGDGTQRGQVTVTYRNYSGSFETDEKVIFDGPGPFKKPNTENTPEAPGA